MKTLPEKWTDVIGLGEYFDMSHEAIAAIRIDGDQWAIVRQSYSLDGKNDGVFASILVANDGLCKILKVFKDSWSARDYNLRLAGA